MSVAPLAVGRPYPLGSSLRDGGINFAVFSAHAERIEVCVFDPTGAHEQARHLLHGDRDSIRCGFLPGAGAGLVYGLRAYGPYAPESGHRFNPSKLLLDPYAREIVGRFEWRDEQFGYPRGHPDDHLALDTRNNAPWALKARVAAPLPPRELRAPHTPLRDSVIYELHVKGFTRLNEDIPAPLRGTYAGLAHPAAVGYLRRLGVSALSLLPVHYSLAESHLVERRLTNYWGYNTIGFFAPDPRLSSTPLDPAATRAEFRALVDTMHDAGIEVLLDVVYNHTAEGSESGPTLSFRGLDNAAWYRLSPDDRSLYENFTGCGNTVNVAHPRVTQFVLDGLRYWTEEMGVDGFRFDLAPVLGRTTQDFDPHAAFFCALEQDPVLARVKLIAEPWDIGPHGYQLGRFPGRFAEWNDRFRDSTRLFWLSRGVARGEFARRIAASNDRFHHGTRRPSASINFVAAHDGFTVNDVVSYLHRHNHANGEHNRDGHHANFSTNCGVEGPTEDPTIVALRARLKRALLATVLLAQGTPMLLAGDEVGHTQKGNNNAYCQDNETSWINWARADRSQLDFVAQLIAARREVAGHQDEWLSDKPQDGRRGVEWWAPSGQPMTVGDWHDTSHHAFGATLSPAGGPAALLLFNPEGGPIEFTLPPGRWQRRIDTAIAEASGRDDAAGTLIVAAHSLQLLVLLPPTS
ncbi:MAG TPA: glycogen debranching protein GlgX [Burkholderiaceae bacterium]|nr:glycogen debranching protein GlgX [Burkholderiaceae bacterium]